MINNAIRYLKSEKKPVVNDEFWRLPTGALLTLHLTDTRAKRLAMECLMNTAKALF